MNLDFTPEQEKFRQQVQSWLLANMPKEKRPEGCEASKQFDLSWQKKLYAGGWAGINWPKEYGGQGFTTMQQLIFLMEYAKADAPDDHYRFNGLNLTGPTIIACGSEEQKKQYLPPILKGEVIWCQGFSEPAAGSDLANLKCRAEIVGDELVVNGSKIWTSWARFADWQQLLVRTGAADSRHKGITWVINRMDNPGMQIRAIKDMSYGDDLHEVFYDNVRIPLKNVVGGINNGWAVSMAQLAFERGTAFMPYSVRANKTMEDLIELAKNTAMADGRFAIQHEGIAEELGFLRAEIRSLFTMTLLSVSRCEVKGMPGPEGSMLKLYASEIHKRLYKLALEILGPHRFNMTQYGEAWSRRFLYSFADTLGGGTSEIQRNIIGERVLGLPK